MIFWQSARTAKQARPGVRTPTARASGVADLEVVVDSRERYAYSFADRQVSLRKAALPAGDYGVVVDGEVMAVVERKSLQDLISSLTSGKLRFQLTELASVPRKWVHTPADAPDGLPAGYPEPVVDHREERAESLRRYEATR